MRLGVFCVLVMILAVPVVAFDDLLGLQGNVFNSTGGRVTSGDITIQIHTEEVGGSQVYAETFTGAINNGEYDVLLGNVTVLDLDQDRAYWMEVLIDGQDMNFSAHSRQVFQSSVGSYENLTVEGNLTVSNTGFGIVFSDGSFQTTASTSVDNSGGSVNGSGSSGGIAVFNESNRLISNSSLFWNYTTEKLGIRTNNPVYALDISGNISTDYLSCTALETNASGEIVCGSDEVAGGGSINGSGLVGEVAFFNESNRIIGNSSFFWNSSNDRLGIGTGSPNALLNIKGEGLHTAITGTSASLLTIQNTNGNTFFSGIDFYGNQVRRIATIMMEQTSGGSILHLGTSNNFGNGVTNDALVIDPTGDVGIGTSIPAEPLHVVASSDKAVRFETDDGVDVVAILDNLNTGSNADGMIIRIGPNSNPGANNDFIFFQDGDGTTLGTCQGDGAGGMTCPGSSDERFKRNITSLDSVKNKFKDVSPIKYKGIGGSKEVVGFSAQDINVTFPQCVTVGAERMLDDGTEIGEKLFLSKECLIAPMWKMIQEQQDILESLEARIAVLEKK
ncbi:MAG: hypothetical protein CMI54_07710 [Parcubacteria group bacterium]|nr:hypothetical protein [Parcubacteria group bacterium]|tara:strand:+ start:8420 stop:10099 length:1680 start_codon:yes stop_codon:yes gene_type:complete